VRVLVAGIGNVFLGDDGFGVEVVRRLDAAVLPDAVDVADYGISGVHLAYDLLDAPYDILVMIDSVPLGESPGTLAVLDASATAVNVGGSPADAHSMSPDVVLRALRGLGGSIDRVLVVGCQPAVLEERMELSHPVRAAVDDAVRMVLRLVHDLAAQRVSSAEEGRAEWMPSSF
jgi:hydrogenase maturation protease